MKKRIVTLLVALCLLVGLLPTVALADGTYSSGVLENNKTNTTYYATVKTSGTPSTTYYYTDLVTAVDEAQANDTITLLDDFTLNNKALEFTKTGMVLDLNGHKITFDGEAQIKNPYVAGYTPKAYIFVCNDASLTIKDGSPEQTGSVTTGSGYNVNDYFIFVYGDGNLTLSSGTINSGIFGTVVNYGTLIVEEAKVINDSSDDRLYAIQNGGTLTIGGEGFSPTIEGPSAIVSICFDEDDEEEPTVSIYSGTIKMTGTESWNVAISVDNFNKLLISGDTTITGNIDLEGGTVTITGGTFSADPTDEDSGNKLYDTKTYTVKTNSDGTYTVGLKATSVSIDEGETTVTYGDTLTLTATRKPDDAINDVTWESSDTSVATVSGGVVTPINAGKATITATIDGESDSIVITVIKPTTMTLTPSATTLEGGGTVTLTLDRGEAKDTDKVTVECSDKSITVTDNENGTYTATLPNATVNYTFTAKLTSDCYEAEDATATVSVTRYVAATTTTTTTNKTETTTETLPAETGDTANTQVGEETPAVEVVSTETVTDEETGTVTTTTEKSDGSTTVVEKTTDGTLTTTDTAATGVQVVTVEAPSQQVKATVTIPEEVKSAVVTIPVAGELTAGMVAMDADTGEIIMLSALTDDGLALKLDGSKNIVIVDNSKDFEDVPENNWVTDGIDYATAHNLFGGTSETTFDPDGDMTRAMLMMVLARFEGVNTDAGATWYEAGMNWAVENEISDGSDPNGSITREQLATMLYRYAGSPAVNGEITGFTDSHEISSYAADAMVWAIQTGILTGNTRGELNPTATATRGQVATMMMRFGQSQVQ
jgi:hypothetical protein